MEFPAFASRFFSELVIKGTSENEAVFPDTASRQLLSQAVQLTSI